MTTIHDQMRIDSPARGLRLYGGGSYRFTPARLTRQDWPRFPRARAGLLWAGGYAPGPQLFSFHRTARLSHLPGRACGGRVRAFPHAAPRSHCAGTLTGTRRVGGFVFNTAKPIRSNQRVHQSAFQAFADVTQNHSFKSFRGAALDERTKPREASHSAGKTPQECGIVH
jgi:hypothetical protein